MRMETGRTKLPVRIHGYEKAAIDNSNMNPIEVITSDHRLLRTPKVHSYKLY